MDACLFLHTKRLDCRMKVNSCLSSLVPSRSKEYKNCFGGGLNFKIFNWSKLFFVYFQTRQREGWKNGGGL